MKENTQDPKIEVFEDTLNKWQNIIDIMAELIGIPAALIMRLVEADIEVFVSSRSDGNPFTIDFDDCRITCTGKSQV